jgi:hypothetical protein
MSAVVILPGESSDRARTELRARPIRLDEYHRMIDTGILDEDERVERLGEVIVEMAPPSERHALAIEELSNALMVHGPGLPPEGPGGQEPSLRAPASRNTGSSTSSTTRWRRTAILTAPPAATGAW